MSSFHGTTLLFFSVWRTPYCNLVRHKDIESNVNPNEEAVKIVLVGVIALGNENVLDHSRKLLYIQNTEVCFECNYCLPFIVGRKFESNVLLRTEVRMR